MKNSSQLELLESVDVTADNSYLPSWATDFNIPNKASILIASYNAIHNWPGLLLIQTQVAPVLVSLLILKVKTVSTNTHPLYRGQEKF